MALISHSVPSLTGGVSQLAPQSRTSAHMESMVNAWPSLASGLQKRNPLENGGQLDPTTGGSWAATDTPALHYVDRSDDERYVVGINSNDTDGHKLRVWDLNTTDANGNWVEKQVRMTQSAYQYLSSASDKDYRFQTVGDVTFIVNRAAAAPFMRSKYVPERKDESLIFVKGTMSASPGAEARIHFEGHQTAELTGATTKALADNIFSALTGADSAYAQIAKIDYKNNYIQTVNPDALIVEGTALKFDRIDPLNTSVGRGMTEDTLKWRMKGFFWLAEYLSAVNRAYDAKRLLALMEGWVHHTETYYAKDVKPTLNKFRLSLSPFGEAIDLHGTTNALAARLQYSRLGTAPVAAFADLRVTRVVGEAGIGKHASSSSNAGNVLYCYHKDGEEFTMGAEDAAGDTLVDVIQNSVSTVSELPDFGKDGFHLKITGGEDSSLDDYYVRFTRETKGLSRRQSLGTGVWKETIKENELYRVDAETMPHILVREADGSFTCREADEHFGTLTGYASQNIYNKEGAIESGTLCWKMQTAHGNGASETDKALDDVFLLDDGDVVWVDNNTIDNTFNYPEEFELQQYKQYWVRARFDQCQTLAGRHYDDGTSRTSNDAFQHIHLYSEEPTTAIATACNPVKVVYVWNEAARMVPPQNASWYGEVDVVYDHNDGFEWGQRKVGDSLTNPTPPFIREGIEEQGAAVTDIGVYKNRLVFSAGERLFFTEHGEYFNFFRTTTTTVLDTAPIDLAVQGSTVEHIQTIAPFGDSLMAMGTSMQFLVSAPRGQPFTPKTAQMQLGDNIYGLQVNGSATPVALGEALLVPHTSAAPTNGEIAGRYSGLTAITRHPQLPGELVHADVTQHVPRYIWGETRALAANDKAGVVAVVPAQALPTAYPQQTIYVLKNQTVPGRGTQLAWCSFELPSIADHIFNISFIDSYLYVAMTTTSTGTGWRIDKINFGEKITDVHPALARDLNFLTHIDRRFAYTVTAASGSVAAVKAATGRSSVPTSFTSGRTLIGWEKYKSSGPAGPFPYALSAAGVPTGAFPLEVVSVVGTRYTVVEVILTGDWANTIVIEEDVTNGGNAVDYVWIGNPYTMSCQLSDQHMRETIGESKFPLTNGRLQVRRGHINYYNTGHVKVTVDPERDDKDAFSYEVTNEVVGLVHTGKSGTLKFPIHAKNDEVVITIENDTPFSSNIVSAEFESTYYRRSRRVQA